MTQLQTYNCMDTIATWQLYQEFKDSLRKFPWAKRTYAQTKAVNVAALYAMTRGILMDLEEIPRLREKFLDECRRLELAMDTITRPMKLGAINFASPQQKIWLLESLGATIPKPKNRNAKGDKTTDRDALEGIAKTDPELAPICNILLAWGDRAKMLQTLRPTLVDKDGRMRTFYKVAGTKTGRWSSGQNAWTNKREKRPAGMNMQNIKRDEDEIEVGHVNIRSAFIADPGHKFINVDLERADSWGVALEVFKATGDKRYLKACGSRDTHVHCARLIWPDRGWNGDHEHDLALAKQPFIRLFTYRQTSKHFQHSCNYLSSAWGASRNLKIPLRLCQEGFAAYHREFPATRKWHHIKAQELQTNGYLSNLFGRRRNFHGRLDDDATLRAAVGWLGQSCTAEVINRAVIRLFACQIQMPDLGLEFLAQVHDSALEQCLESTERECIDLVREVMKVPITVTSPQGETITVSIPLEVSVGWNWAGASPANPDGLVKLKPGTYDGRQRTKYPKVKEARLLDRRLSSLY